VGRVIYRGSATFIQGDRSIAISRCTIVLDKDTKDSELWFGVFALVNPDRDLGTFPDATLVLEDGRRGEVCFQPSTRAQEPAGSVGTGHPADAAKPAKQASTAWASSNPTSGSSPQ
jgi:hypothetical protein